MNLIKTGPTKWFDTDTGVTYRATNIDGSPFIEMYYGERAEENLLDYTSDTDHANALRAYLNEHATDVVAWHERYRKHERTE